MIIHDKSAPFNPSENHIGTYVEAFAVENLG